MARTAFPPVWRVCRRTGGICARAICEMPDEQLLFLSDILPTGYMAAENCELQPGDTMAVWGCGPVGQFAIQSAAMLGAARVIAIDRIPERLTMARQYGQADVINYEAVDDVIETLRGMTGGRGPDACIDAVGLETHGTTLAAWYDTVKQSCDWKPIARRRCAKPFGPAEKAAPSRSLASTAVTSTRFPSARR